MRLFVGCWPPPPVRDALRRVPLPDEPAVRWLTPDQWHVTLRFLGEVDEAELPALRDALSALGPSLPCAARLGPATTRLGRGAVVVPVAGLDALGAAVRSVTAHFGAATELRPFTGHLSIGRARGRSRIPARVVGTAVTAAWTVEEITLVRSHLGAGGSRYETVAAVSAAV